MGSSLHLPADRTRRDSQDTSLRDWVLERRQRLHRVSWAELVERLTRFTDGQVVITTVTLRSWFAADLARARADDELDAGARWGDRS